MRSLLERMVVLAGEKAQYRKHAVLFVFAFAYLLRYNVRVRLFSGREQFVCQGYRRRRFQW